MKLFKILFYFPPEECWSERLSGCRPKGLWPRGSPKRLQPWSGRRLPNQAILLPQPESNIWHKKSEYCLCIYFSRYVLSFLFILIFIKIIGNKYFLLTVATFTGNLAVQSYWSLSKKQQIKLQPKNGNPFGKDVEFIASLWKSSTVSSSSAESLQWNSGSPFVGQYDGGSSHSDWNCPFCREEEPIHPQEHSRWRSEISGQLLHWSELFDRWPPQSNLPRELFQAKACWQNRGHFCNIDSKLELSRRALFSQRKQQQQGHSRDGKLQTSELWRLLHDETKVPGACFTGSQRISLHLMIWWKLLNTKFIFLF